MPPPFTPPSQTGARSHLLPCPCQTSPIEQRLVARFSMTLPAMSVMALFTMLTVVRLPAACAFASPLRLAASLSLTWQAKSEIPFTRLCHPTFRTVAGRTRDQAIGPKWEIGRVRTFL